MVKLEVKQQSRKSKTVVAGVRGLGDVSWCCWPGSASVRQRFRRLFSAWCVVPRRRLLKRASKRPGERGACAFACPPPSTPPISPVSPPYRDWPEDPVGSADNLNLAYGQGVMLEDKGTRPGCIW